MANIPNFPNARALSGQSVTDFIPNIPRVVLPKTPSIPLSNQETIKRLNEAVDSFTKQTGASVPKISETVASGLPKKPKALLLLGAAILVGIGAVVKNKIDAKKEGKINTKA